MIIKNSIFIQFNLLQMYYVSRLKTNYRDKFYHLFLTGYGFVMKDLSMMGTLIYTVCASDWSHLYASACPAWVQNDNNVQFINNYILAIVFLYIASMIWFKHILFYLWIILYKKINFNMI